MISNMKREVRITGDSLYPKRHWDKTFEITIYRLDKSIKFINSRVVFEWKNIQHIGWIRTFQLDRYRFIQKLTDFYVGGI